jgi:hypothetical protein
MILTAKITSDTFTPLLKELSEREFNNAARRVVDKAARTARRDTIDRMAADIGVSKSLFRASVPLVKASNASFMAASWTIKKAAIGILNTAGSSLSRATGLAASTFRETGGGSASLSAPHAFLVNANGGTFVAQRTGSARTPLKAIYAESPSTAMAQDNATPRKTWEKVANAQVAALLPLEVQKALNGARGVPSGGGDD